MGIYDRDYYRSPSPRGGLGVVQLWSVTTWLIVINVVVYFLDSLLDGALTDWGDFSISLAINNLQIWRFLTFQFLHASVQHIFFNMLALYFFGPILEMYLGSRRYLAFYLLSGIGGGLGYIFLNLVGLLHDGPHDWLVGASAGIFGVLIGAARIAPNVRVMLLFPPIPLQLRQLAWICIAIAAYTVIFNRHNAGGEAAHLGGAVIGFLLISNERLLNFANFPRSRPAIKDWSKDSNR